MINYYYNRVSYCLHVLPVQLIERVCCAAGDWLIKDNFSLMGLRAGFLEAYARELYKEWSTSLFHRRVAVEVFCEKNIYIYHHLSQQCRVSSHLAQCYE